MRVFQVCGDLGIDPGGRRGSSIHLRAVAAGLIDRGHQVFSLASRPAAGPDSFPAPLQVLSSIADILRTAEQAGSPDVIYERYTVRHGPEKSPGRTAGTPSYTPLSGLKAAREIGCVYVLEVNSPMILESVRHRGLEATDKHFADERALMSGADAVAAVSEPMRRYVADVRGSDLMTATIHNGFHPAFYPTAAALNGSPPVLAFYGNPRPWHGLDRIPSLLAALRERGLHPVARIIGGPLRPGDSLAQQEFARLDELAARYSVREQIDVVGPVSQQEGARLLAEATAALAPYPPDPFFYFSPIKLFEYMAAGLPVVSVSQGDIAELLGDAGIVVLPGDKTAFADAVERLLRDEPLRRHKGAIARERAFGNFTWDHTAAKLERLFHELAPATTR